MRALVFDLDGTLLQFEQAYTEVLRTAFEAVCGSVSESWLDSYSSAFADALGEHAPEPAQRAFEATIATGDPVAFASRLHEAEIAATTPPPGAHEDLDALGEEFALAVLTNGPTEWQRGKLTEQDLASRFDVIVTSYAVGEHKPDTAPYRAVEEQLGADSYAMIGDSDSDIEGATAAGWESIRYTDQRLASLPATLSWGKET